MTMNSTAAMTSTDCLTSLELETNTTDDNTTLLFNCSQTDPLLTLPGPVTTLTYISFGVILAFVLLGVFGNLLTFTVMVKFRNTLTGHDILIVSLAICDCVAVVMTAPNHPSVYEIIGTDMRAASTVVCKLYLGIWMSVVLSSAMVIVHISIERFVAVWLPLRARNLFSRQRLLRSVCVSVAACLFVFVTLNILYSEIKDGLCYPNLDGSAYSTVLKQMPDTTFYSILLAAPQTAITLILSILTPMTIGKLIKQMTNKRTLSPQDNNSGVQNRITLKLIVVVIAYMVLVGLPGIGSGVTGLLGIDIHDVSMLQSVLVYAFLINHSTNFLIYNLFDNSFRKKVVEAFGVKSAKDRPQNAAIELPEIKND